MNVVLELNPVDYQSLVQILALRASACESDAERTVRMPDVARQWRHASLEAQRLLDAALAAPGKFPHVAAASGETP